jgi:glycolate oxidase
MLKPAVLQKLVSLLGQERCKTSKEDLLTYSYDAYVHEYLPDAVLFPRSAQEVSQIVKVASEHNIYVTPRGAGSGLMGSSSASP